MIGHQEAYLLCKKGLSLSLLPLYPHRLLSLTPALSSLPRPHFVMAEHPSNANEKS